MTSMGNLWDSFITALLRPFMRARDNRLRLQHTIEVDKLAFQQRQLESVLEAQATLATTVTENVKETTAVLREWLEGFHKLPTQAISKPPVNDEERMWRLEMEAIARERGKVLADNMSPHEIEAFIREGINGL